MEFNGDGAWIQAMEQDLSISQTSTKKKMTKYAPFVLTSMNFHAIPISNSVMVDSLHCPMSEFMFLVVTEIEGLTF